MSLSERPINNGVLGLSEYRKDTVKHPRTQPPQRRGRRSPCPTTHSASVAITGKCGGGNRLAGTRSYWARHELAVPTSSSLRHEAKHPGANTLVGRAAPLPSTPAARRDDLSLGTENESVESPEPASCRTGELPITSRGEGAGINWPNRITG